MKKISILWFSSSENTYKRISLTPFKAYLFLLLHLFLYAGFVTLLGICIYQQFSLIKAKKEILSLNNKIESLTSSLKLKQSQILSLKEKLTTQSKKISFLQEKLRTAHSELDEMKEMEVKIKKFLGIENEEASSDKFSHQGGFEYKKSLKNNVPFSLKKSSTNSSIEPKDIISYSKEIKENFEQLVSYLQQRHEELRHIPSILPVKGNHLWISCGFGWRINPFTQQKEFHAAIDIAGEWKTPIVAPADGVVIKVSKSKLLGNYVKIRHTDHIETLYGHLYKALVKKGDKVRRWDVIGYMGNTGHSTGTHVHYKIMVDKKPVNPIYYIYDRRIKNLVLR